MIDLTISIQLTDSITLFVTATDSNGCTDVDSVHINVIDPPLVKIPNLITDPNDRCHISNLIINNNISNFKNTEQLHISTTLDF